MSIARHHRRLRRQLRDRLHRRQRQLHLRRREHRLQPGADLAGDQEARRPRPVRLVRRPGQGHPLLPQIHRARAFQPHRHERQLRQFEPADDDRRHADRQPGQGARRHLRRRACSATRSRSRAASPRAGCCPTSSTRATLAVTINGVRKTVGIYGQDDFSAKDVLYRDADQSIQVRERACGRRHDRLLGHAAHPRPRHRVRLGQHRRLRRAREAHRGREHHRPQRRPPARHRRADRLQGPAAGGAVRHLRAGPAHRPGHHHQQRAPRRERRLHHPAR